MYKSEKLAQSLTALIHNGTWQPHDKLPSLRFQSEQSGFSLITVLHAYRKLEAQGLIYAKEKSGYFVSDLERSHEHQHKLNVNDKIEINSTVFHYLKSIQTENITPFGSAFPNSQITYSAPLIKTLGHIARSHSNREQMPSLPPGHLELRKIIAQRYCLQGIPTDPSDIVITSGGLDALNLALQALTRSGDYILLQETVFYGAWQAAERLGLKVITIPEHPEFGIDLKAFKRAIQIYPIKVCMLMLNAQNPIGFTVPDEVKQQLALILQESNIHLIEDDVYEELYFGAKKPLSMKFLDQENGVLHCSSFSKTLGSGFRLGWIHAGKYSEKIQHIQLMSTLSVNLFIQNALVEYLSTRHYDKHLKHLRAKLEKNKQMIYRYLYDHLPQDCYIHYYPSGYFLWLKLPENINSMHLYEILLTKNISIAPSQLFNANASKDHHHLRINCSFDWDEKIQAGLDQLIDVIQKAVEQQKL
ncbi:transcriptional regulator (plasmid) [Acinetobacter sp. NCu2D-2]|uniref:aminotransferase-like domain-containing protein n=1 Tax=Acinetobacter sp. NCu2D-2 TaxID=1608473 RepID=UPI0007CDAB42|nr:PLP-dependent aminotransferase family protein [Acinetobacter sp. NCu2D-2]ANF83334.1 transcriptional regulator [Acinetobacter sp. NCu2D-2]